MLLRDPILENTISTELPIYKNGFVMELSLLCDRPILIVNLVIFARRVEYDGCVGLLLLLSEISYGLLIDKF